MKYSLFLLLLVSTLSAITSIDLGMQTCVEGIWTDATPSEGGTVVGVELPYVPMPPFDFNGPRFYEFIAYPNEGYVFSHWLKDGNEIIEDPHLLISYGIDPNEICVSLIWPPVATLSAVFNKAPVLDLETFYDSNSGESITIDATPTDGYPTNYTYQWYFNEFPIQSQFGGTGMTFTIDGASSNNATWRVEVTNDAGTTSAEFEYRVFTDADSDGLSDYRENNILGTNPDLADSDTDGLSDYDEVYGNILTNPLVSDTDGDGLSDGDEINGYSTDPLDSDSDDDGMNDFDEVSITSTDPNNSDSDGDGVGDSIDSFPNDPSESIDTDSDGVGDNADAFDNDPTETTDADGDGVGDNADAFDNDPTETTDSDGDGVGDNADVFDNDPTESADSDGDGFGDNADGFPTIPTQDIVSEILSNPTVYNLQSLYPTDVYITGDISENTTWASDITYFLDGVISIMPGVTLNIEPGTVIRGLHSGETTNGDLSILFVLPGAKLVAKGTEENPIIFTNKDDTLVDINPYNPGDRDQYENNDTSAKKSTDDQNLERWGGIYILGNAYVDEIGTHRYYYLDPNFPGGYLRQDGPLEPMGLIKEIISLLGESPYPLERIYDTNDDSGDLEFISIRYTGDTKVYSPDRGDRNSVMQPNGLTLYGVGNGTDISNIEVFNTGDDAFKFHGGSVQPSKLAGIIFGDECFEFNYGWSGQINKIFGYGTEYSSKFLEVESYPTGSPTMNHSTTIISFASYINNYTSPRSIAIRDGGILDLLNSYISSSFTDTFYQLYDDSLFIINETNAYLTPYPTMEGPPNTFTNAYINDFEKTKSLRATHGAFANTDIWTQWMIGHKFLINNCSEYVALSMPQDSDLGDSDSDGIPDADDLHTGFNDRNFEFYIQNNTPTNFKTLEEFNTVVAERDAKLTLNEVADLRTGSAMIEVSNNQATIQIQMEESSNLESWTEIGDAATMVVPADTDTKFFRFKMTE